MQVAAIGQTHGHAANSRIRLQEDNAKLNNKLNGLVVTPEVPTDSDDDTVSVPTIPTGEATEDSATATKSPPGVMRLLESGHFNGVADVRLRINFFDTLQAQATQDAGASVAQSSSDLVETFQTNASTLLDSLPTGALEEGAADQLLADFAAGVESAVGDFIEAGATDIESLEAGIQDVFGALLTTLTELLSSQDPAETNPADTADAAALAGLTVGDTDTDDETSEPGPDSVPSVDGPATTPPAGDTVGEIDGTVQPIAETLDIEGVISDLTRIFEESLNLFLTSFDEATQLQDPSPSNGNGGAYDKFLAIYNELRYPSSVFEQLA